MTTTNDLNVGLARLMGWTEIDPRPSAALPNGIGRAPDQNHHGIPDYCGSLDSLFAPGGPVEYARDKEWRIDLHDYGADWQAQIEGHPQGYKYGPALPDPAEALATALHEALGKEAGNE